MNLHKKAFTTELHGKKITLETSRLAEQANAAVLGVYGQTTVLATVVMGRENSPKDYLPLTVEFEERFYAAGKILGSRYVRREGKASDVAVLNARIIDRTIRPLFDQRIRRDIQVVITILSLEENSDPVFIGLLATSAALTISDIPWNGPAAGVPLARDSWKAFIAGTAEKINMIELEGFDVPEESIIDSFTAGLGAIKNLV